MKRKTIFKICICSLVFILLLVFDIYRCPFRYFFGISCPTCGLTRAIYCILTLKFKLSFHYHLLWPIIMIGIIIFILYELKIIKLSKKTLYIILCTFAILNFIYYLYRFVHGSEIVYFNFKESLLYRIYLLIKTFL